MKKYFSLSNQTPPPATRWRTPQRRGGGAAVGLIIIVGILAIALGLWQFFEAAPSSLTGWHHDLDSGIKASEATGKPMLVLFTADWCPPCRQLKKNVLTTHSVASYLQDQFVTVKIDLTERDSPNSAVAAEFGVQGIPTMFVYDQNAQMIDSIVGGMPQSAFLSWIKACRAKISD